MTAPTLTDFLLARIAEDEAVARAASPGPWSYTIEHGEGVIECAEPHPASVEVTETGYDLSSHWVAATSYDDQSGSTYNSHNDGEHIARHDPARVLAECEAKRRIVEWASDEVEWVVYGDDMLRALAAIYADHSDYRDEWRP